MNVKAERGFTPAAFHGGQCDMPCLALSCWPALWHRAVRPAEGDRLLGGRPSEPGVRCRLWANGSVPLTTNADVSAPQNPISDVLCVYWQRASKTSCVHGDLCPA